MLSHNDREVVALIIFEYLNWRWKGSKHENCGSNFVIGSVEISYMKKKPVMSAVGSTCIRIRSTAHQFPSDIIDTASRNRNKIVYLEVSDYLCYYYY